MTKYELIFEALQEKINSGELTLEEAELVNDIAYEKYVMEDGHSKKLKARHNAKKKHIEQRFYDNMNYEHNYTDEKGTKHGTVQRGDGGKNDIVIPKKGIVAQADYGTGKITIGRNVTRMKGSDLAGSHEYSHILDSGKIKQKIEDLESSDSIPEILRNAYDVLKLRKSIRNQKPDGFDEAIKKYKKTNSHDKRPEEVRADVYAATTTKGENNSNRQRKLHNELLRRSFDSSDKKYDNMIKDMKKTLKDKQESNDITSAKKLLYKGANITLKGADKIGKKIIKKYKSSAPEINKNRQNVTDYVINKTKEQK